MMPAIFTIPEIGGEYLPDRRCSLDIVEVFLPQAAPVPQMLPSPSCDG
jgi:hypothetical protein